MQTVHILQVAVVGGAVLFFFSGLLVQRLLSGSRQTHPLADTAVAARARADETSDVTQLNAAVELLESRLGDAEGRAREAEENVRALKELVKQQPAASRPKPVPSVGPNAGTGDEIARLQEAVEQLEFELREARAARDEAQENVRALQELARQQGDAADGAVRASRSPTGAAREAGDQVSQMHAALTQLEDRLAERQEQLQDARERMAAMEELLRERGQ